MNKVFAAQYPDRVSWARVFPYASYLPHLPPIPWTDNHGSLPGKWFGTAFSKPIACERANFMSSVMFGYGCA